MDDQKTLFQELNKAREKMHLQMLSSVSHDLKTPLASMIGALEIHERLKATLSEDKKNQLILTALQEAYRLDRFITNILDMNRLENGLLQTLPEQTEIIRIVRECQLKLGDMILPEQFRIEGDPCLVVNIDQALILRALSCLVENACRHSGGGHLCITVRFSLENQYLVFEVMDNGQGIPDGKLDSVFEKYTRYASTDRQSAGTGLGLAICQAIARLTGGDVTARNLPEGGACFTLRIGVFSDLGE